MGVEDGCTLQYWEDWESLLFSVVEQCPPHYPVFHTVRPVVKSHLRICLIHGPGFAQIADLANSVRRSRSHVASRAAKLRATYSASVEDKAITACFFEP